MEALTESEVTHVLAADVEPIGVLEMGRVVVASVEQDEEGLPRRDALTTDVHVLEHPAHRSHARPIVAQELFDCAGDQVGVGPQVIELARAPQEGERAVADEVRHRLVPGDEEQRAVATSSSSVSTAPCSSTRMRWLIRSSRSARRRAAMTSRK